MENFNLKQFLVENKLTTNSRILAEDGTQGPIKILQVLQNYNPDWVSFEEFENQQGEEGYEGGEDGYDPSEGEWPVIGDEYDSVEEMKEEINYYNQEVGRDSEIVAVRTTVGDFKF